MPSHLGPALPVVSLYDTSTWQTRHPNNAATLCASFQIHVRWNFFQVQLSYVWWYDTGAAAKHGFNQSQTRKHCSTAAEVGWCKVYTYHITIRIYHVLNEAQQKPKPKPRRPHSTHNKNTGWNKQYVEIEIDKRGGREEKL